MLLLTAVALVGHLPTDGPPTWYGTCFSFRRPTSFLTAQHVIKGRDPAKLSIHFATGAGFVFPVTSVLAHASTDIAILQIDGPPRHLEHIVPFTSIVTDLHLGEEFGAFGFPEDLFVGEFGGGSPHRLLMGHYQRFFDFKSLFGYRYWAGEMNTPCPKGLSGGPLFRPQAPNQVSGLVAESIDVESVPSLVAETTKDGKTEKYTEKRMISYGIAVMLWNLQDWVNEHIPPS